MSHLHLVLVLALSGPGPVAAGDTVRGLVTDAAGVPLVGAELQLVELNRRTLADSAGAFAFLQVQPGTYTLVCRHVGRTPVVQRLTVRGGGSVNLQLQLRATPFELDAVTVTATRSAVDPFGSPLAPASLSAAGIARVHDISVAHAVEGLPGVRALTTGGEIGKPVVRGLTGARVLVLDDGHRLEDYSWSDEDGPSVDAALSERVEVIRGPASVLYGSDALAGVIHVVPEALPDISGARGQSGAPQGAVDLYGASNNAELGLLTRLAGAAGGLGWRLNLAGRRSEALHTPGGVELENTGFAAIDGSGTVGTRGDWGSATFRVVHYGGEFHLLEADTASLPPPPPPGGEEEGPVRKLADDRVQFTGEFPGLRRLEVKSQWQRHWLAEEAPDEPGFDLLLSTGTLDVLLHRDGGTIGVSGSLQASDSRGQLAIVPDARVAGAGAFAFQEIRLGRWSVLGGARVDARHLQADSNASLALGVTRRDYVAWAGDAGIVFRAAEGLAFTANAGRAWRAPTLFELFANGPHVGEARYELGDPGLRPEAALDVDVSLRWRARRWRGEVTGFSNWIGDYLYITPTGATRNSLPVYAYAQGDAWLRGAEVLLEGELRSGVTVRGTLDHVRGSRRPGGEALPLTPPLRGTVSARWQAFDGPGLRLAGRVESELVARQEHLAPYDVPTAGYGLLHAGATAEKWIGGRRFHLELDAHNVLDRRYRDFLSRYKAFALNPGRNLELRIGTEL